MINKIDQTHIDMLKTCPLPNKPVHAIGFVTQTQFSIARHYGGIKFKGHHYTYLPEGDQLVREDVLKWLNEQCKPAKAESDETQNSLFGGDA